MFPKGSSTLFSNFLNLFQVYELALHKAQYNSLFNEQKVIRNQLLFRLQSMIYQRLIYLLIPTINKKHAADLQDVFLVC